VVYSVELASWVEKLWGSAHHVVVLLHCCHQPSGHCLDLFHILVVLEGTHSRQCSRHSDDGRPASEVVLCRLPAAVVLVLEKLSDLFRHADGFIRLFLVPVGEGSFVVDGAQDLSEDLPLAHADAGLLDALQRLQNDVMHLLHVQHSDNQRLVIRREWDAGIVISLHHAHHILPVLACLTLAQDVPDRRPATWRLEPVDVFECQCDIAQRDLHGFGFEFRLVFFSVDELPLLWGEVEGQEDFGIGVGEERRELRRRGLKEQRERACAHVSAWCCGACGLSGKRDGPLERALLRENARREPMTYAQAVFEPRSAAWQLCRIESMLRCVWGYFGCVER
jgi:hypothetical protein